MSYVYISCYTFQSRGIHTSYMYIYINIICYNMNIKGVFMFIGDCLFVGFSVFCYWCAPTRRGKSVHTDNYKRFLTFFPPCTTTMTRRWQRHEIIIHVRPWCDCWDVWDCKQWKYLGLQNVEFVEPNYIEKEEKIIHNWNIWFKSKSNKIYCRYHRSLIIFFQFYFYT